MTNITISAADIRALLDVTEGFVSEHGLDSVARYASPEEVARAVANASAAIREPASHVSIRSQG